MAEDCLLEAVRGLRLAHPELGPKPLLAKLREQQPGLGAGNKEVREALTTIGVRGMMVSEVKGFGAQSGHTEIYRGAEYAVNFVPKVKLEIVVADSMAEQVVNTITTTAKTGKIGDGKIFVIDVESALRVRTGDLNDDAL